MLIFGILRDSKIDKCLFNVNKIFRERFRSLSATFYRGAKGSLLTYDITNRKSFTNLGQWLKEFRNMADSDAITILIGNKCDLVHLRAVTVEEGKQFAEQNGLLFLETSALDNTNVGEAFYTLLKEITKNMKPICHSHDQVDSVIAPTGVILDDKQTKTTDTNRCNC